MSDAVYSSLTTAQQREVDRLSLEYQTRRLWPTADECRAAAIKQILDRAKQQQRATDNEKREFDLF